MTGQLPDLPASVGEVRDVRPLSGGMIAEVWRVSLADGADVVVKAPRYDARLEAEGLAALEAAGAPVPAVLAAEEDVLVLEFVSGSPDWAGLGAQLATVHRTSNASFGWHRDNVIGPLPQSNTRQGDWASFYVENRIRPWLDTLPDGPRARLAAACEGPMQQLLSHEPTPSLVHGDLWSGNVVDGRYLIDPAVHHADREFELAFADLFGGIPPSFWSAYEEVWLLPDGWQRRRPALQLYHLLVHVELFGSSYVPQVVRRLDSLGW
ncbi:MAG: fructosamine kinase family protein [Nitriliruptorales bacterium]|nr:fructosamine kinase family protein [Nitriliruptorales bacterium]